MRLAGALPNKGHLDAHLVKIVKFLARRVAEIDYAEWLETGKWLPDGKVQYLSPPEKATQDQRHGTVGPRQIE